MALPRGDQALSSLPSLLRIEAGSPKLQKSPPVERAHLTYDQTEVRGHRARALQNKAAQAPDSLCPQGQSRGAVAGGEEPEQGRVPHCRLSKPPLLLHALVLEPDLDLRSLEAAAPGRRGRGRNSFSSAISCFSEKLVAGGRPPPAPPWWRRPQTPGWALGLGQWWWRAGQDGNSRGTWETPHSPASPCSSSTLLVPPTAPPQSDPVLLTQIFSLSFSLFPLSLSVSLFLIFPSLFCVLSPLPSLFSLYSLPSYSLPSFFSYSSSFLPSSLSLSLLHFFFLFISSSLLSFICFLYFPYFAFPYFAFFLSLFFLSAFFSQKTN